MKGIGWMIGAALSPGLLAAQSPPSWTEPMAPVEIVEGLYYVGTAGLSAFLLTSDEGHILIDAPMEENVPLLLESIRATGHDPSDVRIHVATHAHYDHVGGFSRLLDATGGELWVSDRDAGYVESGSDFGFDSEGYPGTPVTRRVDHLEPVRVGGVSITAHLTPGHTPGCTSWSGSVRVGGEPVDFVLLCSLSVLSMYRLVGENPTYPGHGADYCRSVAHLRSLDADIFLANHGTFFGLEEKAAAKAAGDASAFVDRDEYTAFLDRAEASIERALSEQGHQGGCLSLLGRE